MLPWIGQMLRFLLSRISLIPFLSSLYKVPFMLFPEMKSPVHTLRSELLSVTLLEWTNKLLLVFLINAILIKISINGSSIGPQVSSAK